MVDGGAGADAGLVVRVDSLAAAGAVVEQQGTALARAVGSAGRAGESGLAALPPSDLFDALAFCWGRWSAVLDTGHRAVRGAGSTARTAAGRYRRLDEQIARRQ